MHFIKYFVAVAVATTAVLASPVLAEGSALEKRITCWYQSGFGSPIYYVCPGACGLYGTCK